MKASAAALGAIAGLLVGAAAASRFESGGASVVASTEVIALAGNTPQADRGPPPHVPPVEIGGVRYEQDLEGAELGGRLAAVDPATGRRLWTLDVYRVADHEAAGVDAIGRYFRTLSPIAGRDALLVEDETGARYAVDLATRTVTVLDAPTEEAAPPKKPKPEP